MKMIIIGNGIAGISAAKRARALDPKVEIILVSDESVLHWSRPALMYLYMGQMRLKEATPYPVEWWRRKRIELIQATVTALDLDTQRVCLDTQRWLPYDRLLIATGSRPRKGGWTGEDLQGVTGLYHLADLKRLEGWTPGLKRAIVVGGGLVGVELAEMLLSRGCSVTLIVREASFAAHFLPLEESKMVDDVLRRAGIDLRLSTTLQALNGGPQGEVLGVTLSSGETVEAQMVGVCVGVEPNLMLASNSTLRVGRGVRVDRWLRTSARGVFAAGDCAELCERGIDQEGRGKVWSTWYTSREMGEVAAENMLIAEAQSAEAQSAEAQSGRALDTLEGELEEGGRPYDQGVWFNSAKFFHLEQQVYGESPTALIPAPLKGDAPPLESLFWRDSAADRSIRVCHRGGIVVGLHLMGIRYRQAVCADWIERRATLDEVIPRLSEANFDPELSARFESELMKAWRVYAQSTSL